MIGYVQLEWLVFCLQFYRRWQRLTLYSLKEFPIAFEKFSTPIIQNRSLKMKPLFYIYFGDALSQLNQYSLKEFVQVHNVYYTRPR